MKITAISILALVLIGCGETNPGLTEDDIGYIPSDVNQTLDFALVHSIDVADIKEEITCDLSGVQREPQKITTQEELDRTLKELNCDPAAFPEIDFKYDFIVYGGNLNAKTEQGIAQAKVNEGALALYNVPPNVEAKEFVTQPFNGWVRISPEYINLPLKPFHNELIQF